MSDTQSDIGKTADKANQIWAELLPVIAFVGLYNIIRIAGIETSFNLFGLDMAINNDTALYWATGVLIIATLGVIVHKRMNRLPVPLFMLMSAGIVGTFGVIGIVLQDKGFIYAKPTIQQLVLASIILGSLAFGQNIWKVMFEKVFQLPDRVWDIFALRWACYFVAMAAANEFIWRYYAPGLETPLNILGFQWAPAGTYQFLGLEFGSRDAEGIWATWWKLATWGITVVFMIANTPLMLKYLQDPDTKDAEPSA
ncbi:MAG: septation protein IspZ [Henriciella sp.]|nr:septation protein IspZ [Henriciella sp.]